MTSIDPWFLEQMKDAVAFEAGWRKRRSIRLRRGNAAQAKRDGMSDISWRGSGDVDQLAVREKRKELGIRAVFNRVDTCAAEFESFTPYLYSSYESECEAEPADRKKVMILGSGPNRIGQGIEFDYCCCHASFALQGFGVESIMVNCNPETVSTDYDTSDRLYFEPLTLKNVLNICDTEKPDGVIVQFGGQTPLNLALPLKRRACRSSARTPRTSTWPRTASGSASCWTSWDSVAAERHGHQRGGGVRGGAADRLPGAGAAQLRAGRARHGDRLRRGDGAAVHARGGEFSQDRPVLIDRFLEDATEIDVDALGDGEDVLIGGIMEHIEEAGVHSGDSSCVLPAQISIPEQTLATIEDYTVRLARALNVIGLMNMQYAIQNGDGVRAGSEPARFAHGAVRQQGDRRAAAEDRGRADAGQEAEGIHAT